MQPVCLYREKFIFSITAQYIIYMLKGQCHYALWVVPLTFFIQKLRHWRVKVSFLCNG